MHATTWMNLKNIILSDKSHLQNTTCCMISFIWNVHKRQIYVEKKQMSGCLGLVVGAMIECRWAHEYLGGFEDILKPDCGDGCTTLYIYQNNWIIYLEWMNFMVTSIKGMKLNFVHWSIKRNIVWPI